MSFNLALSNDSYVLARLKGVVTRKLKQGMVKLCHRIVWLKVGPAVKHDSLIEQHRSFYFLICLFCMQIVYFIYL